MDNIAQGCAPEWTLGDRLRKVRRAAGYSSRDFAAVLGINVSSLAHYETDRARPRDLVMLAQRIQAATGVPATWLVGLEPPCPGQSAAQQQLPPPLYYDVPLFSEAS